MTKESGARDFSLLQTIQTGSGAHPVFYAVAFLHWGKVAGA
jgi:hypothetical protein